MAQKRDIWSQKNGFSPQQFVGKILPPVSHMRLDGSGGRPSEGPDSNNPVIARDLVLAKTADRRFSSPFSLPSFSHFPYIPFFIFFVYL
jgi:hypothetical protein